MHIRPVLALALSLAVACSGTRNEDDPEAKPDAGTTTMTDAGTTPDAGAPAECEAVAITCEDALIQELNLQRASAPGAIANEADGSDWLTSVDASAGGAFTSSPHSYVYATFDPDSGLKKVEIGDEASLESMDWDIAFRRYVVRINSGDSGPSCVRAARMQAGKSYEDITAVADNFPWRTDDYFSDSCTFIPDGSGLPSAPASALSSYWSYDGCLKMTGNIFVIELRNGRHVKFQMTAYYGDNQSQCDVDGASPTTSARMRMRWSFID